MEVNRRQPIDILTASNLRLQRKLKYSIGIIIFLAIALLACILLSAIYIP
jgi:hypothetical protein